MIIESRHIDPTCIYESPVTLYRINHTKLALVPFEIMGRHEKQLYHVRLGELVPHTPSFEFYAVEREAAAELVCLIEDAISDASARMDKAKKRFNDLCDLERSLKEKYA